MDRLAIARTGADTSAQVERLLNDQRRCTRFPSFGLSFDGDVALSLRYGRNLTIAGNRVKHGHKNVTLLPGNTGVPVFAENSANTANSRNSARVRNGLAPSSARAGRRRGNPPSVAEQPGDGLRHVEGAAPGQRDAGTAVAVVVHQVTPARAGRRLEPDLRAHRPQPDPVREYGRPGQPRG